MATISPASKSIEIAKAIRDIDLKVGQADLKGKAADLISALADVKISLVEANDQLHAAEKEIERLKETLRRKDQLLESRGFLYRSRTDGSPQGNPACPVCLEKEARIFFYNPHSRFWSAPAMSELSRQILRRDRISVRG
ncbi:hypothetical protein IVA94_39295 [Bradyrhizobium sp. 156]|uniref:hypothetical protein n=1 Tax=Bradyrhizobium sp. 156 TaxID=2782630 RepID=UPI001FFA704F|nr:hypothetical protein [Bradyrhizobium sp. 156]MCK1326695.1 hypothetical protein [Bradyrhizobium sp. 156]